MPTWEVKATEKSRMMADTMDSVSCDQKPIHPKRRQAAAALCRLRRAGSGSRLLLPPWGLSLAPGRKLALLPELLPEWPGLEAAAHTCRRAGGRVVWRVWWRVSGSLWACKLLVVLPELEGREDWQSSRCEAAASLVEA